jgi:hypothetical protein
MPCLIALLALVSPRLALFALWLFGDLLDRAYDSWIIPLIGFFLLPWTTLAYAVMWSLSTNRVSGLEWLVVIGAVLVDLGAFSRGRSYAESRG